MPRPEESDDRRRTPRFSCAGEARIYSLPSDGVYVPGRVRNLSLGGLCLDTNHAFDLGGRTEILVSVNAASFRSLGLVRAAKSSRASMEFIQMSAASKGLLADLMAEFERLAAAANKLRSERFETEDELRRELEEAGLRVAQLSGRELLLARSIGDFPALGTSQPSERTTTIEAMPFVIKVDLFG
ncbi:MAG: PilZ domain-containing protein [Terriglobales bacterium]